MSAGIRFAITFFFLCPLLGSSTAIAEQAQETVPPAAGQEHEFDEGSGITISHVNDFQLESLVLLGKVWSFLKYHHPLVGRRDINWDYALFRVLPAILYADTETERQRTLIDLVESLGPVNAHVCSVPSPEILHHSLDLDWIYDPVLGSELTSLLEEVYERRYQEQHYVVRGTPYQPYLILNENNYEDMEYLDAGFRLLTLFRYWGVIEYYYPYRYAIDGNWHDVLAEFIPSFLAAETPLAYQLELQRLIISIDDSHAVIVRGVNEIKEYFGTLHTPIILCNIDDQWVVDKITHETAACAGIRVGDVVTMIDDLPIKDRVTQLLPYINASTIASRYYSLGFYLLRGNSESVQLTIQRGGDEFVTVLQRMPWDSLDMSLAEKPAVGDGPCSVINEEIGYAYIGLLSRGSVPRMMEVMNNKRGLILDLREYPYDDVVYDLAEYILPEDTVFARFTLPDFQNPGTFVWIEPAIAGGGEHLYEGKIAILIDEGTFSSGEFTAMAWRLAPEARIFGTPSNGTDGNVVYVPLPGGMEARITGLGVYNPDGSETQMVGILPDVYVRPTVEGMQAGRDELLESALEWLNSEK